MQAIRIHVDCGSVCRCVCEHVGMSALMCACACERASIRSTNNNHLPNVFLGDAYKINSKQSRQANNWTIYRLRRNHRKNTNTNEFLCYASKIECCFGCCCAAIADVVFEHFKCCSPARTTINEPIRIQWKIKFYDFFYAF